MFPSIHKIGLAFSSTSNSILKASYDGFINLDMPTFGDIAVLAKGKLKKNANKTFSFEQINEGCDDNCQANADKYLENVTALWMVERIRHRDDSGNNHRYDMKFTIVPVYHDQKQKINHNILQDRMGNQLKKTFLLRDSDYPNYFQAKGNRRADSFTTNIEQSISSFMNINPNNLMQNLLGLSPQKRKYPKDGRLNTGEYYMAPKIQNSGKPNFHPAINGHAAPIKFPDSREMMINRSPQQNNYRPRPELYNFKNFIDYRGAVDNMYVGSSDHQQLHTNHNLQANHQQLLANHQQLLENQQRLTASQQHAIGVPVFSIPYDTPLVQFAQPYGAFPIQLQLSTPASQLLYHQQPEVTTFRYPQPPLLGLHTQQPQQVPVFNPYVTMNLIPANKSKLFKESERYTMNYYSPPDPVFHHEQSTTEAPIHASTYLPRFNNYANIVRPQIDNPVQSTANSIQINMFNDDDFQPMTPPYDARKYNQFKHVPKSSPTTTQKPDSINAQLNDANENATMSSFVTPISDNANEVNYEIVMGRPKSSLHKFNDNPSEKPVLKWTPKKQRIKQTTPSLTTTSVTESFFLPTVTPSIEITTQQPTRLTTQTFRGRNRFNRRNSSSAGVRSATISPLTTKLHRKQFSTISAASTTTPYTTISVFPTYVTPFESTDEPVTSQSLSTSISLEVNGERVYDHTTPGYELVSAGVEAIQTNNSNVKLFKASVVPEKFDDLTFSILNHAKAIEDEH